MFICFEVFYILLVLLIIFLHLSIKVKRCKHGVDLEVHKACTVELGIYIPQVCGARVEDTLIIQENKLNIITDLAKKNLYNE